MLYINQKQALFQPKEIFMPLWIAWWSAVEALRPAFTRYRTFLWFGLCLAGYTVREDSAGVSSIMRSLGLLDACYDRLLHFFHSPACDLGRLTRCWVQWVIQSMPGLLRCHGRLVLVGDGIKIPKAGRKMPAVKCLHQESDSNNKPPYIMGHSCQAVAILAGTLQSVLAIPLVCRIHEGLVFSNRDQRTLLDKFLTMIDNLLIQAPFYLVLDAYYASGTIVRELLANNQHLITRARTNAVAFLPASEIPHSKRKRGHPRKYGNKIRLRNLFAQPQAFTAAPSPVYGEQDVQIRWCSLDLLWNSPGCLVRFVLVIHPHRGRIILMCTDLNLPELEILRLYALRFKIEVSFKQALRTVGTYHYHFWMKAMQPIKRFSKNQYLHGKTALYRNQVCRKLDAYHRHIQCGLIVQGLLQYLALACSDKVWRHFGSWIRTIRPGILPSEQVTAMALRNTLAHFLAVFSPSIILAKFIRQRADPQRSERLKVAA
jgi:hypothetical protein